MSDLTKIDDQKANDTVQEELNAAQEELRVQNEALREAYYEVEKERLHYATLFALIPDAYVVTDTFATILDANAAAEELLGVSGGRLRGKPLAVFVEESDRREFRAHLNQVSVTGEQLEWEGMLIPRAGSPVRVTLRAAPLVEGTHQRLTWLIRDNTEKQRVVTLGHRFAEEQNARIEAERTARRFRLLAEASRQLALQTDIDRICENIVKTVVRFLGDYCEIVLRDGAALKSMAHVNREKRQATFTEALRRRHNLGIDKPDSLVWRAVRTNEPQISPAVDGDTDDTFSRKDLFEALRKNGPRNAVVLPLSLAGESFGALIVLSATQSPQFGAEDIGVLIEIATRASLAIGNARLFKDLERANSEKAEFLAVLSHELRTPLTAVIGYADLLLSGIPDQLSPIARDHVERIRACSWHELSVIEQIIRYARVERGEDRPEYGDVDVNSLVTEVSEVVNVEARVKNVQLSVDLPSTSLRLRTDAGRLRQILINLLNNAFKFTDEGAISMIVRGSDEEIFFTIADTGLGIAADDLHHVFDPFWRADATRSAERAGMGLGLAVSASLARSIGGELSVQSQPDVGSTFTLRLPVGV
jgi:PAS domain S-box-containing protein